MYIYIYICNTYMYVYIIYIIHYIDIKKHKKTTSSNTKAFVHILVNFFSCALR